MVFSLVLVGRLFHLFAERLLWGLLLSVVHLPSCLWAPSVVALWLGGAGRPLSCMPTEPSPGNSFLEFKLSRDPGWMACPTMGLLPTETDGKLAPKPKEAGILLATQGAGHQLAVGWHPLEGAVRHLWLEGGAHPEPREDWRTAGSWGSLWWAFGGLHTIISLRSLPRKMVYSSISSLGGQAFLWDGPQYQRTSLWQAPQWRCPCRWCRGCPCSGSAPWRWGWSCCPGLGCRRSHSGRWSPRPTRPTHLRVVASSPSPHSLGATSLPPKGLPGDQGASFSSWHCSFPWSHVAELGSGQLSGLITK